MNLPLSFRGIVRLAKKHKLTLTPGHGVRAYKDLGTGCALTAIAVENGLSTYDSVYNNNDVSPTDVIKLRSIEDGFEGFHNSWGYAGEILTLYNRYRKIGERLRAYAGY